MGCETPRRIYRLDNYKRAFALLREAIDAMQIRELTQLEKEGVIQRLNTPGNSRRGVPSGAGISGG